MNPALWLFSNTALLWFSGIAHVWAQPLYGNEWVRYPAAYIRIPVAESGWYHLPAAELGKWGVPLDIAASEHYRLYSGGREVGLRISAEAGRVAGIEFYGERNDGRGDAALYVRKGAQPHTRYSLYTDTTVYFLAWAPAAAAGKRIAGVHSDSEILPVKQDPWFMEKHTILKTESYSGGAIYPAGAGYDNGILRTAYDTGEGWSGPERYDRNRETIRVRCREWVPGLAGTLQLLLTGRSSGVHHAGIQTTGPLGKTGRVHTISWQDYESVCIELPVSEADLAGDTLAVSVAYGEPGGQGRPGKNSRASLGFAEIRYPRKLTLPGEDRQKEIGAVVPLEFPAEGRLFDISESSQVSEILPVQGTRKVTGGKKLLWVQRAFQPGSVRKIRMEPLSPATDYLIITHPALRTAGKVSGADPVSRYAAYRSSAEGGGFTVAVVESRQLYDEFNYGVSGPLGIGRAIGRLRAFGKLRYVFLVGKSVDPQTARAAGTAWTEDLIPNAGWPGADLPLVMDYAAPGAREVPVALGRLPAATPGEVENYLHKVMQHEKAPASALWRKQVLHLSGGTTPVEQKRFERYVRDFEEQLGKGKAGVKVTTLSLNQDTAGRAPLLREMLHKGIGMLTYFGHSGLAETDAGMEMIAGIPDSHGNSGKYPLVIANGCALGNTFFRLPALSSNWVLAKERGAVLFLAHTHNGLEASMQRYTRFIYEVFADPAFTALPFGLIQSEAVSRYLKAYPTLTDRITAQQMLLLGDPAVRLFPARNPDYFWDERPELSVLATGAAGPSGLSVKIRAFNGGICHSGIVPVRFTRRRRGRIVEERDMHLPAFPFERELRFTIPFPEEGAEIWHFMLDPGNKIAEEDETNNGHSIQLEFSEAGGAVEIRADSSVAVPEKTLTAEFDVFPVPAGRWVRFRPVGAFRGVRWEVNLYDRNGRLLTPEPLMPGKRRKEVCWVPQNLPAGVYFYNINVYGQQGVACSTGKIVWEPR